MVVDTTFGVVVVVVGVVAIEIVWLVHSVVRAIERVLPVVVRFLSPDVVDVRDAEFVSRIHSFRPTIFVSVRVNQSTIDRWYDSTLHDDHSNIVPVSFDAAGE